MRESGGQELGGSVQLSLTVPIKLIGGIRHTENNVNDGIRVEQPSKPTQAVIPF